MVDEVNQKPTFTVPVSRIKAFRKTDPNLRWGQAFYDYLELHKITDPVNKAWCDRLYNANSMAAIKMMDDVVDYNN